MVKQGKATPDYGFTRGLKIQHHDIGTDAWWQTEVPELELGQAVPNVSSWLQESSDGDVRVRLKLVSAERDEEEPRPELLAIHFDSWSQSGVDAKALAAWRAAPQDDHLWVGQLGREGSSQLGQAEVSEVSHTGSFDEYGKVYAKIIDEFIASTGYSKITLDGSSIGSRFAVSAAANLKHQVDSLTIIDAPGDHHMSVFQWIKNFALVEGRRSTRYHKQGQQPSLSDWRAAVAYFKNTRSQQDAPGVTRERWLHQANAARRAGLLGDLEKALNNVQRLNVVTMEHSAITDSPRIIQQLGHLAVALGDREILTHTVLDHSHAVVSPKRPELEVRILKAANNSRLSNLE
jgi:pimeloyl-ACP methyl ester carboxylesterase